MGLFEEVGRRVERFKQRASEAAAEEAEYECTACGQRLYADAEACPECGAETVESLDTDTPDSDAETDGETAEDTGTSAATE